MNKQNYNNLKQEMEKLEFVYRVQDSYWSGNKDEIFIFCDDELSFDKINTIIDIGNKYYFKKSSIFSSEAGSYLIICLYEVKK